MCGLTACFSYGPREFLLSAAELLRSREAMVSRGPDGSGLWISPDGRVGLAHRRLSIIDLSETGNQPMATDDGVLRVVFNGEIYNYHELRSGLEKNGFRFRSTSDTEVLLISMRIRAWICSRICAACMPSHFGTKTDGGFFLARDPSG